MFRLLLACARVLVAKVGVLVQPPINLHRACNAGFNFTEPTLGFFARFPVSNETRVYPNGSQVDQGVASKAQPEPEGEMEETETPADPEAPLYLIS